MIAAFLTFLLACASHLHPEPPENIVWIPSDTNDPCNTISVGDKVSLFWANDAAGTSELVDPEGRVVAREEGRIGVRVRGELPPGTRPVPAIVLSHPMPEECRKGGKIVQPLHRLRE